MDNEKRDVGNGRQYALSRRLIVDVFGNNEEELRSSIDGAFEGIVSGQESMEEFDSNGGFAFTNEPYKPMEAREMDISRESVTDDAGIQISDQERRILSRLLAYGEAVVHTTTGFELDGGEFLCRTADMTALVRKGLVESTRLPNGVNQYWLSQKGLTLFDGKVVKNDVARL